MQAQSVSSRPAPHASATPWHRLVLALAAMGPGILAMAGDNDAGGLLAYAATGARFGLGRFLPLLLGLAVLTFAVQEAALRLGHTHRQGLPALFARHLGRPWTQLVALDLAVQNSATLVSEFAGMGLGLAHFGLPLPAAAGLSLILVGTVLCLGSSRLTQRVGLVLAAVNLALIPLALTTGGKLHLADLAQLPAGPDWPLYAAAMAGNALAPWMLFFQARATAEREPSASLATGRLDLLLGTLMQVVVAAAVLRMGGLSGPGGFAPLAWLDRLAHTVPWAGDLMAFGLFDAGFLACLTVSLTTAWTVTETWLGVEQPAPRSPRQDPLFYLIFGFGLTLAALAVAVPHAPLVWFAVGAQALSAVLLPPLLGVVVWLADRPEMGSHRSAGLARAGGWTAAAVFALAALAVLGSAR